MTDNEVVKALKCCVGSKCTKCHYYCELYLEAEECMGKLIEEALNLINRQIEEIEVQDQAIINALHYIRGERAENIKEVVERLCDGRVSNDPVVIAAKCLLREMTEEDNG